MDKDFKPINEIYLNQAFSGNTNSQVHAESQAIAKAHVLAENAIVSMGNNIENCSYCYFGGLADTLGILTRYVQSFQCAQLPLQGQVRGLLVLFWHTNISHQHDAQVQCPPYGHE